MEAHIELSGRGFSKEEFKDVMQCLQTLLAIRAGSQPMDRELGIDYDSAVGYPLNIAENMLSLEIIEKIHTYEPRVEVDSIRFKANTDGLMIAYVRVVKSEEEREEE